MLVEFYRNAGKHLWIDSLKEALQKSQDLKSRKIEEKKEEKKIENRGRKDKIPKKPRTNNNRVENRYVAHYTNYTPLNAPIDHIFVFTRDKSLFGEPDIIK